MYTTLLGDSNKLNALHKITHDGLCEGLDLNNFQSLLSVVIKASNNMVDVTNKQVMIDNKAFSDVHLVVAINNEEMENKENVTSLYFATQQAMLTN